MSFVDELARVVVLAAVRIVSGNIHTLSKLNILLETFTHENIQPVSHYLFITVTSLSTPQSKYRSGKHGTTFPSNQLY